MKRYYIVYEGMVQGVGFRWQLMNIAKRYKLSGYVRNLDNGNVEAEVQGADVDLFLKDSLKNDSFARVDNYSLRLLPLKEKENGFTVRF